jgi:hypothetical protein
VAENVDGVGFGATSSKSPGVDVDQVRAAAALDFRLAEDCYDVRELRMTLATMTGRVYGLANMVDARESAYERGVAAGRASAAADIRAERDRWDRLGYSDEGAWLAAIRAAEGGGEADHQKALDRVWWLHRCDPTDPKRAWLSEVPGVPRPVACPGCGGSGWGWFEARPVVGSTERDGKAGANADESSLPASTGGPDPRPETQDR